MLLLELGSEEFSQGGSCRATILHTPAQTIPTVGHVSKYLLSLAAVVQATPQAFHSLAMPCAGGGMSTFGHLSFAMQSRA